MKIVLLDNLDFEWDRFVGSHCGKKVFTQSSDWLKVISESYGHKAIYAVVYKDYKIIAALPLFLIEKGIFGNFLTSLPGGILTKSEEAIKLIIDHLMKIVLQKKLSYLNIKDSLIRLQDERLKENARYFHMIINTNQSNDLWSRLKPQARNKVRRSFNHDFRVQGGHGNLEEVYNVIKTNYKRLGTPMPSLRFFKNIMLTLGDRAKLLALFNEGRVVGGSLSILFGSTQNVSWYSCLPETFHLQSNYRLYWETINRSAEYQVSSINLGTSKLNSGNYQFKSKWHSQPMPLFSYYFVNKGFLTPDYFTESQENGMLKSLKQVYRISPSFVSSKLSGYFSSFEPIAF